MPDFHITAPDGTVYNVSGPPGSTQEEALAQVQAMHAKDTGGILKNFGAGAVSGLTGLGTQMASTFSPLGNVADIVQWARGKGPQAATPLINQEMTRLPNKLAGPLNPDKVSRETLPEKLSFGAGVGATGALIPGSEGYTVGNMLRNAILGMTSGTGAVAGGEGAAAVVPERFKPAARTIGSVVGGVAAPMGAVGAVNAARGAANYAREAATGFTAEGPKQTVGKVLAEAAGGRVPEPVEAPLPGMKPTTGQATGDQGLLYLERSAEQATPEGSRLAQESRAASNSAIMDAVQKIGDVTAPAAETMLDRLEKARDASRLNYQKAWRDAGIEETTPLQIAPLKADINEFVGSLSRSGKAKIPPDINGVFKDFGDTEPLREIQDWRSDISTALRAARKNGDANGMRILGNLSDRIDSFLEEVPTTMGQLSPEQLADYNAARAATKTHKETFSQPGSPVATALNPKEFGTAAESNTANLFIKPRTSAGAPEAWDAYLKAIGNDPQGMQAARDAFAKKFTDAIAGVPDSQGNVTIKPAAVSKFLDKYDHIINSDLFTQDQRNLLGRIDKAAQMTARTARAGAPGGSDTFAKLSGKSWVDALVGTGAKKVARTIGGTLGYATGGPFGAAAGAYGAPKVMETMLAANKAEAMKLLTQALYDPELAKTLMTPATKASANAISLPLQARIFGVLSGRTANDNSARKVKP